MKKWYNVTYTPTCGVNVITLAEDEETAKKRAAKTAHEEILKGIKAVCEEYDMKVANIFDGAHELPLTEQMATNLAKIIEHGRENERRKREQEDTNASDV